MTAMLIILAFMATALLSARPLRLVPARAQYAPAAKRLRGGSHASVSGARLKGRI
ncbi:hypothetical protein [uncultured Maritimibacter sp.]|jgi:hypothetical protein|uniref:hypothetical protein n=1 Tax=uncultured Maritimibacter sp. TaxID=991866 RepID=UPI002606AEA0|nr:hypothetical protein [uncultured Maritimibacter sp.]